MNESPDPAVLIVVSPAVFPTRICVVVEAEFLNAAAVVLVVKRCRGYDGEFVPMPTLPVPVIRNLSVLLVSKIRAVGNSLCIKNCPVLSTVPI